MNNKRSEVSHPSARLSQFTSVKWLIHNMIICVWQYVCVCVCVCWGGWWEQGRRRRLSFNRLEFKSLFILPVSAVVCFGMRDTKIVSPMYARVRTDPSMMSAPSPKSVTTKTVRIERAPTAHALVYNLLLHTPVQLLRHFQVVFFKSLFPCSDLCRGQDYLIIFCVD